jgi:hypothetical protein
MHPVNDIFDHDTDDNKVLFGGEGEHMIIMEVY